MKTGTKAYCSERVETFYDIQLQVKGMPGVIESFRKYTESEMLDGDNKYDAGEENGGKQDAKKGKKKKVKKFTQHSFSSSQCLNVTDVVYNSFFSQPIFLKTYFFFLLQIY